MQHALFSHIVPLMRSGTDAEVCQVNGLSSGDAEHLARVLAEGLGQKKKAHAHALLLGLQNVGKKWETDTYGILFLLSCINSWTSGEGLNLRFWHPFFLKGWSFSIRSCGAQGKKTDWQMFDLHILRGRQCEGHKGRAHALGPKPSLRLVREQDRHPQIERQMFHDFSMENLDGLDELGLYFYGVWTCLAHFLVASDARKMAGGLCVKSVGEGLVKAKGLEIKAGHRVVAINSMEMSGASEMDSVLRFSASLKLMRMDMVQRDEVIL